MVRALSGHWLGKRLGPGDRSENTDLTVYYRFDGLFTAFRFKADLLTAALLALPTLTLVTRGATSVRPAP